MLEQMSYFSSTCQDFIDNAGSARSVSRVIMPLRLIENVDTENNVRVSILSGCSYYRNCQNGDCTLSKVFRDKPRFTPGHDTVEP